MGLGKEGSWGLLVWRSTRWVEEAGPPAPQPGFDLPGDLKGSEHSSGGTTKKEACLKSLDYMAVSPGRLNKPSERTEEKLPGEPRQSKLSPARRKARSRSDLPNS